ncbi:selenoneine synthase SenA [Hydrogenophaga pseudoflava]|uniref:selenoneine synthase SenA n=1 Tax=Hydrogenophaga pseudoflava TaxID=47421 RepID=UPI0027E45267|nr:selenoneine synthase SenA [Hydrogenophaga pseudoflava]MDQ7746720.1 selenoneine synthase SenA [Hydrogenophaga pseudoflava]
MTGPQSPAIVSEAETARCGGKALLAQALTDARERSMALFGASQAALGPDLRVPCTPELNPPLWELGHIGWFADWWLARNPQRGRGVAADPAVPRRPARQAARGVDADALYNSSEVPHDRRWQLDLPDADAVRADLAASLADTLALLEHAPEDDQGLYFFRLALFHEDMHAEAAMYMAQTLGFDPVVRLPQTGRGAHATGFLDIDATTWTLGRSGPGFAFDNELGPHAVPVAAFEIDAQPVSWARFLPFVEHGSYAQRRFWSAPGWIWRLSQERQAPRHLRRTPQGWEQQRFGRWQALDLSAPASHLSAFEAQAWCAWAGRRLPTEAEWEVAAQRPGFRWGEVWEWTASPFAPYPGFVPHPYVDYSRPWFDGRPVLKGASAFTVPRMRHPQYRNYFTPERNDILAGFRSVALA